MLRGGGGIQFCYNEEETPKSILYIKHILNSIVFDNNCRVLGISLTIKTVPHFIICYDLFVHNGLKCYFIAFTRDNVVWS